MINFDAFYGITTTTLVVLSSTTLAVFQFLSTSVVKKIESYNEQSKKAINKNHNISEDARILIYDDYEKLQANYSKLKEPLMFEIMVLFVVILSAAVSVFLVLLNGVLFKPLGEENIVSIYIILNINLFAILLFIVVFCSFLIRIYNRRKGILSHGESVDEFLKKVDLVNDARFKTDVS